VTRITKVCVTALLQLFMTVEPGSLATSTRAFYDDLVAAGAMHEMEELAKKRKRKKKKGSATALEGGAAKAVFTPAMAAGALKSALMSAGPACDLAVRSFLAQAARKADTAVDGPTALVATLLLDPSTGNAMRAVDSDAIKATMMLPTLATLVECTAEENTLQVALMDMWLYQLVYFQKVPTREGANALSTITPAVVKTLEGDHGHVMCRYALSCGAVSRIAALVDALMGRLKKDNWVISLLDHLTRCLAPVVNSAGYPLDTLTEKVAPEKLSTEPWAVTVAGSVSKAICVLAPLVQRKTVTDLPLRVTGSLYKSFAGLMARASPVTLDAHVNTGLCVATADLVDLLLSTMGDDKTGTSLSAVTAEGNLAMILTGVCWLARTSTSLRTGFGGIVKDLSTVPPAFMTDRRRHVVIPALLALCLDDANNVAIVREEMSTTHFTEYLSRMESELHNYEKKKKKKKEEEEDTEDAKEFAALRMVANRFPVYLWNAAWEFF